MSPSRFAYVPRLSSGAAPQQAVTAQLSFCLATPRGISSNCRQATLVDDVVEARTDSSSTSVSRMAAVNSRCRLTSLASHEVEWVVWGRDRTVPRGAVSPRPVAPHRHRAAGRSPLFPRHAQEPPRERVLVRAGAHQSAWFRPHNRSDDMRICTSRARGRIPARGCRVWSVRGRSWRRCSGDVHRDGPPVVYRRESFGGDTDCTERRA